MREDQALDDNILNLLHKKQEGDNLTATGPIEISIIIPAYNEYHRLPPTLLDVINYMEGNGRSYELIVVDDGSSDGTPGLVEKFQPVRPQISLIKVPVNTGKGNAVREGMLHAKGILMLFADADGSTPIEELKKLELAIHAGADIAIASRAKASSDTEVRTRWYRRVLGRIFNACVNFLILPGIADTQCGFKLFTRKAARFLFSHQRSRQFSFDVELLFLAQKTGLLIEEIPVNWHNVPKSKVNLLVDSMKMFRDIFRFRIWHRKIRKEDYETFSADTFPGNPAQQ